MALIVEDLMLKRPGGNSESRAVFTMRCVEITRNKTWAEFPQGVSLSLSRWYMPSTDKGIGPHLVVADADKRWTMKMRNWLEIMAQFSIFFQGRPQDYLC
jgi:hypothetical protein